MLAKKNWSGLKKQKQRLAESYLRLALVFAKRYRRNVGMAILDLIQEGNMGNETVEKFDYNQRI